MQGWIQPLTRLVAAIIALRALTNIFKPLGAGSGLVFFGKLLGGLPNLILAPAVGVYLLVYAYGMYDKRQYALPMGLLYTVFVTFNVFLFPVFEVLPGGWSMGAYSLFGLVAIGGAALAVWLMWAQRDELV